jgi:hypothetical protein
MESEHIVVGVATGLVLGLPSWTLWWVSLQYFWVELTANIGIEELPENPAFDNPLQRGQKFSCWRTRDNRIAGTGPLVALNESEHSRQPQAQGRN